MSTAPRDPFEGIVLGGTGRPPEPPPAKSRLSLKELLARAALDLLGIVVDSHMRHKLEDEIEVQLKDAKVEERRKQNHYLIKRNAELEEQLERLGAKSTRGRPKGKLNS